MTIQLELDFLPSYAFQACSELRAFSVSLSGRPFFLKEKHLSRYLKLLREAKDLKHYAFMQNYIECEEYALLFNSILESSDIYWS